MRGRKPIPTELKRLNGNPGKRPLNDKEPQPEAKLPRAPSFLNKTAQAEWRHMGKVLFDQGLLTELDQPALEMYCTSYSRWREANEAIEKYGAVLAAGAKLKPSPWFAIANASWKQMTWMLVEFGLTPSSRTRVQVALPPRHLDSNGIDWFGDNRN